MWNTALQWTNCCGVVVVIANSGGTALACWALASGIAMKARAILPGVRYRRWRAMHCC
jgi:hypothetical protein